jgi:hypothetical protein
VACTEPGFSVLGTAEDIQPIQPGGTPPESCRETYGNNVAVYRSQLCLDERFPPGAGEAPWTIDFDTLMVIEICDPFGGCGWPIGVDSIQSCAGELQIDYWVLEPCSTCDGLIANCVFVSVPSTPESVDAHGELIYESCR